MKLFEKILTFTVLALALSMAGWGKSNDVLLDGNWLEQDCYGCPGDQLVNQVKEKIIAYREAKSAAEIAQAKFTPGDYDEFMALERECVNTALYSYVKAMYADNMGLYAQQAGELEKALGLFNEALQYAKDATEIDSPEENKNETSIEQGNRFIAIAKKQIKKVEKLLKKKK